MQKQRILVSVVGFSDVERHALNTIFRLSQDREIVYAPWAPSLPAGPTGPSLAQVALVDGESAEAVLSHAKAMPAGQRLIWVGPDAPEHAWRVLDRPIAWADVLHDLDSVFAAHQVDSGLLDLDITAPAPLSLDLDLDMASGMEPQRRALVASEDPQERTYLRTRLALAGIVHVDEVDETEVAVDLLGRHTYLCGVFNLDDHHIDTWSIMRVFVQRNPHALTLATSELAGPLAGWWRRRRVRRDVHRVGVTALLARPLQPRQVSEWLDLI
ncbi:hypothetical protein [Hydrogenophaga sp.]|uniref:hypothetical protein n=1 Tax=Hydrogenophaga sp. TaxID=1904254 RepID=UPI00260F6B6D|nr:hypothetical protein [Hydrogenophaga sp.]MCW5655912.1 hypothetical protein [Hydrogenophaga sp.]